MALNIETALVQWLLAKGYKASADVPSPHPDEFITSERTGGDATHVVIDHPTVAIQGWSTSRDSAARLAYEIDDLIKDIVEIPDISSASRNSLYNFPDEVGTKPR
jgi:hypothetical protein